MLADAMAALVTFLVILDPLGMVPIFMAITHGQSAERRRQTALRAIIVAAAVLVIFAVGGHELLPLLAISMSALRIAGGLLLLLLSIDMVLARHSGLRSTTTVEDEETERRDDVAVFPLAVPLIAGPGAITSSILIMDRAAESVLSQVVVIGLMLAVLALTYVTLRLASSLMNILGVTGINVIGRVLGIILAALAVQYVIDGINMAFFMPAGA